MSRFVRLELVLPRAPAERVVAEAWAVGASGLEEQDLEHGRTRLILYAPAPRADVLLDAARRAAGPGVGIGRPEPVPEQDWSEAWKRGLGALRISPRLLVRPPFAPSPPGAPRRREVIIEPGRAFGTGAHASTALALELLDEALAEGGRPRRVLDVGTGSGVLALAALRLGAEHAWGVDLDPVAVAEARANARRNRLESDLSLVAGPLEALAVFATDLVLANLLRTELLPLLPAIASRTAADGRLVLSGLLAAERTSVEAALAAQAFRVTAERARSDERGERWLALTARR